MADTSTHPTEETEQVSSQGAKDKTIGQVLSALDVDFPGITASKIRFLEDRGLVHPQRTNTGYRKYSANDVEQLRHILLLQRDRYLPLKVIKELVEEGRLEAEVKGASTAPEKTFVPDQQTVDVEMNQASTSNSLMNFSVSGATYNLRELATAAGVDLPLLRELINFGLIREKDGVYDDYNVVVTKVCSELTAHGIQPRHLRQFRAAAEREVGLVETAVAPLASRKDEESQAKAAVRASEIAHLCLRLHIALVASSIPAFSQKTDS